MSDSESDSMAELAERRLKKTEGGQGYGEKLHLAKKGMRLYHGIRKP